MQTVIIKDGNTIINDDTYSIFNLSNEIRQYRIGLLGDVNNDGILDSVDVTLISRAIANMYVFSDYDMISADVNCDGIVNSLDVALFQR